VSNEPESTSKTVYVLDTSVLLADPRAMFRFAEHLVVLPFVVFTELEGKRNDPGMLGFFAREALRFIEDLRIKNHNNLSEAIVINDQGGTLLISGDEPQPGASGLSNDRQILEVAKQFTGDYDDVVVVSNDLPLRVWASYARLSAEAYRAQRAHSSWSGTVSLIVSDVQLANLFSCKSVGAGELDDLSEEPTIIADLPVHACLSIKGATNGSALARVTVDGQVKLINGDAEFTKSPVKARSGEQRMAVSLLRDPNIGIVSLGGPAGTGKSLLALMAGLEAVQATEGPHKDIRKIVVFRPTYAVGGQELGYLPGTGEEKMAPWGQAVIDALESVLTKDQINKLRHNGELEILPFTHLRGRTIHNSFIIVDEAQNLERNVILTTLSRLGQNSRVVLTHDVAQRDNLRVGRYDGIAAVVDALKGERLFAHMTLTKSERSAIAELVTRLLDQ
jgi:PhoH-like ATPase